MAWYAEIGSEIVGPIEEDKLAKMIRSGCIEPTTLVRRYDGTWRPASKVMGRLATSTLQEVMCLYCHSSIPALAVRCRHCGEWVAGECKSPALAAALSAFWIGAGVIYAGGTFWGLMQTFVFGPVLAFFWIAGVATLATENLLGILALLIGIWGWMLGIISAYDVAEATNRSVARKRLVEAACADSVSESEPRQA